MSHNSHDESPVIIEAAINGMTTPEKNPRVPQGPEAIAAEALLALELGASIIHAHNRDIFLPGKRPPMTISRPGSPSSKRGRMPSGIRRSPAPQTSQTASNTSS